MTATVLGHTGYMPTLRADLHLHSSFSNKPTYWALRKFNCPESFTSPLRLYDIARSRAMDFVTITDHNSIDGCLEIAHLPRTFISSEITAHFPENGCKVHVVTLDLTASRFKEIMALRHNIYDVTTYLRQENIAHFLCHPLYAQNDKLTVEIIEKCLLLFNTFEVKNGCRARRFNAATKRLITALDEESLYRLADKHELVPYGITPWKKGVVGGSDDHGGLFIARAHTTAHQVDTLADFLGAVRSGNSWADGEDGGPLTMAHSMYGIAHSFYKERLSDRRRNSTPFVTALLNRFFDLGTDTTTLVEKIRLFILKNLPEPRPGRETTFEQALETEARRLLADNEFIDSLKDISRNRKIFAVTSRLANRILYGYTKRLMELPLTAGFFDYLTAAGSIGLTHLLVSPYYLAFHHQHKGKELIHDLERDFPGIGLCGDGEEKIALFTDTLDEINGVAITIRKLIGVARERGSHLTVIMSGTAPSTQQEGVVYFPAVGDVTIPEYPELRLSFPPILDVLDFIEKEGFTSIHVSTPGTVGLLGLLIGRIMDLPVAGTYHTDIPPYVRSLTNDEFLEQAAWKYMVWFYNQMGDILVPSMGTREQLISRGIAPAKLKPLPRWVDTRQFTPERRISGHWQGLGLRGNVLLYVGRVSREKSVDLLAAAFRELVDCGLDISLVIVGDGPCREELAKELDGYPAHFTGFLQGESLELAYASADLFVFPSATDTFGNVVLEAQASGLPVIVTDRGGPQELMQDGKTGVVFPAGSRSGLVEAVRSILRCRETLAEMGHNARAFTLNAIPDGATTYCAILNPGNQLDKALVPCPP